jgi:hypothetical protein
MRAAGILLAGFAAAGCGNAERRFDLDAVAGLAPGVSTREQVEAALGPPAPSFLHTGSPDLLFHSRISASVPAFPLNLLVAPFWFAPAVDSLCFLASFGPDGVLKEASLTLGRHVSRSTTLLLIPLVSGWFDPVGMRERPVLLRIQARGFPVRIITESGIRPLDKHLDPRSRP